MKIDANKCALSVALAFGILWIICSLVVFLLPGFMMSMSGNMMHGNFANMGWHLSFIGVLLGLIGWSFVGGITTWLSVVIYNRLTA